MVTISEIWKNKNIEHKLLFKYPPEIKNQLCEKYKISSSGQLIKKIENIFQLAKKGEELENIFLGDLLLSFHHPKMLKNNETGKEIEKKFGQIFSAKRNDEIQIFSKDISKVCNILKLKEDGKKQLIANCKNKPDLLFSDNTTLSFKSGIEENKEINFGSFEFLNVIADDKFKDFRALKERKRGEVIENISDCGLGSQRLLKNTYKALLKSGLFEEFLKRFELLFETVFDHDIFFYGKNKDSFEIWFLKKEEFKKIILHDVENGFDKMRWEGNAIRSSSISKMKANSNAVYLNFNEINLSFVLNYFS